MDVAAFVFAAVSLVISAGSLGWQIAAWLLESGRVRVVLRHGLHTGRGAFTAAVSADGGTKQRELEIVRAQGYSGVDVLGIAVTNTSRAPVTVVKYAARLIGAGDYTPVADALGPELPHRLEPGTTETWFVTMEDVAALVDTGQAIKRGAREVAMLVELGTGKTVVTRRRLRL